MIITHKKQNRQRQMRSDWRKHHEDKLKVLILDRDMLPIDVMLWKDCIKDIWNNNIKILSYYDIDLNTVTGFKTKCPAVIMKNNAKLGEYTHATNILPMTRQNIFDLDEHKCCYCGADLKNTIATVEHVIPIAFGGPHTWDNVRAACWDCNIAKGDNYLHEIGWELKPRKHSYVLEHSVSKHILKKVGSMYKPKEWKQFIYW